LPSCHGDEKEFPRSDKNVAAEEGLLVLEVLAEEAIGARTTKLKLRRNQET
jgi:hypothetical protein